MTKHVLDSLSPNRRQVLLAAAGAAGASLLRLPFARAATVPYSYDCDKQSAFVLDPNAHRCVGYLSQLNGLGLARPLAADLTVSVPALKATQYSGIQLTPATATIPNATAKIVGVLEKFSWNGGVGDVIQLDFWVSQQNATQLKAMQQATLKNTVISALGWWIVNYDVETKLWYERAYPESSPAVSGIVGPKDNPALNVDLTGAPIKSGVDVMVYKVSVQVAPAANKQYALHFANSSATPVSKSWGLVVGSLAGATK